ncbi:hypothetical protein CALCODRAFT_95557 [Calocera cornea HHB12733]|uniref:Uncharacterized protein n=1 Tax=Calocera cornea HHB12733 TaxID=1353952 RepID=A0A165IJ02_9BASI|nr:hypothetical protein CALCODRAFT_95557 [Calocera cornea HHB12733]
MLGRRKPPSRRRSECGNASMTRAGSAPCLATSVGRPSAPPSSCPVRPFAVGTARQWISVGETRHLAIGHQPSLARRISHTVPARRARGGSVREAATRFLALDGDTLGSEVISRCSRGTESGLREASTIQPYPAPSRGISAGIDIPALCNTARRSDAEEWAVVGKA